MTQRAAKIVSISILVAVIVALGALFAVDVTGGERLSHPPIVEIGDPDTPGFAQVRADLQDQLRRGNELHTSQSVVDAIIAILAVGWGVTGWLIVSRQPHNRAGWLFCIGAATVAVAGSASAYTIYGVRLASNPLPGQDQVALVGDNSLPRRRVDPAPRPAVPRRASAHPPMAVGRLDPCSPARGSPRSRTPSPRGHSTTSSSTGSSTRTRSGSARSPRGVRPTPSSGSARS